MRNAAFFRGITAWSLIAIAICRFPVSGAGTVSGELKKWHKITITFRGPSSAETAEPNPFLDYRLEVTFTNEDHSRTVPGYFAADGDAANTGAAEGDAWRVHFCPDKTGTWNYTVSFRQGEHVAISDDPLAGDAVALLDGQSGSFDITASDKSIPDNRARGQLRYVGERYLRWAETGDYFIKQGPDAPENFLAYREFDGDFKTDGNKDNLVKDWAPHEEDWQSGDPSWSQADGSAGAFGQEIVGALNYLASEELNAFSFLTMNITGDDRNVFPYRSYTDYTRMDCSRLDQWEIVFEHADHLGLFLHFKTQETENDDLLDDGALGPARKLYYRELIARFSHHLALNWNLGEENTNSHDERVAFAQYFRDHDPYNHHIVIHTYPNHYKNVYEPLMGDASALTGASLQTSNSSFSKVHERVLELVRLSEQKGKKWAIACDEPGDASHSLRPDNDAGDSHTDARKNALWGTLMAGGWGNEWYFGYQHDHSDLTCTDYRSRDAFWDYCRIAIRFFNQHVPFWSMECQDELLNSTSAYCLAKTGETYLIYLRNGGTIALDLSAAAVEFAVQWFDTRNGGELIGGDIVSGGSTVTLGPPPSAASEDWAVLLTRQAVDDDSPPSTPANLKQTGQTNTSSSVSWTASADPESGIKAYKVYVDGALYSAVTSPAATISGLSRNTGYDVTVSAVNWAELESPHSATLAVQTANQDCAPDRIYLQASAGTLRNGMQPASVNGSISSEVIYGTDGSTAGAESSHSKATFTVLIPTDGEYMAWFRTRYTDDQANSWWLSINGGDGIRISNGDAFGSWHWEGSMSEGGVSLGALSAGDHTLVITVREPAADNVLDIICITSDHSFTPTDADVCFHDATPARRGMTAVARRGRAFRIQRTQNGLLATNAAPGARIEALSIDGARVYRTHADNAGSAVLRPLARGRYIIRFETITGQQGINNAVYW